MASPLRKAVQSRGSADSEEAAVHLVDVVPYLLEDALKEQGATFSATANAGIAETTRMTDPSAT